MDETTPHTMHLSWTVTEGEFDSFEVQYTHQDGQLQVLRLEGNQRSITLSGLESNHRYLVNLYGFHGRQRLGPIQVQALTGKQQELCTPCFLPDSMRGEEGPGGHLFPLRSLSPCLC